MIHYSRNDSSIRFVVHTSKMTFLLGVVLGRIIIFGVDAFVITNPQQQVGVVKQLKLSGSRPSLLQLGDKNRDGRSSSSAAVMDKNSTDSIADIINNDDTETYIANNCDELNLVSTANQREQFPYKVRIRVSQGNKKEDETDVNTFDDDMELPLPELKMTKESQHQQQHEEQDEVYNVESEFVFDNDVDYTTLAKKEEPGDKEAIIRDIKQFQAFIAKDEPIFPLETIISRTFDTVEDIFVHIRRVPYDFGWIDDKTIKNNPHRETVVILGSGWAAHAFLKVADTYKQRIIVISPSNHFVFTPMLASASVGTVEYRSMTEAVRAANPMIENYIEGSATDIDVQKKVITVQLKDILDIESPKEPIQIPYDKLIVAVGVKVADSMVPGAYEFAYRLKSCDDSRVLRTAIGEAFEYASRPDVKDNISLSIEERTIRQTERRKRLTFTIVGGGPTGVEFAGELADFVQDICRPRVGAYPDLKEDVSIMIIQGASELVPEFDTELSKSAYTALTKAGIDVRLNTRVQEVGDRYIKLKSKLNNGQDVETVPCAVCVWAAGTESVPFIRKLLTKLPKEAEGINGKVYVDKWLRCPMPESSSSDNKNELLGSILVMGDAAAFVDRPNSYLPQTAQVAAQQGAYAARLLDREYDLTGTPPTLQNGKIDSSLYNWLKVRGLEQADGFKFLNLGMLAYIGGGQALSQVQIGDVPLARAAGSTAFLLWRSVYFVKQVATRNRVLVTFDWIKSAIFGRDITRL